MCIKHLTILALIFLLSCLYGCSSAISDRGENSLLDKNWGRSFETAKYQQIIDHEAQQNLAPNAEIDGEAAQNSSQKYKDSFKEKDQREVVNILKLQ